jgi:ankyrin repeat protein
MATQLQKIQQALAKVEEDIEATKEELRGIVTQIPFWAPEKWLEATEFILNLEPIDLDTKSPSPTIHTLIETVLSYPEIKVAKTTKQDSHLNLLRLVCRTEEDIREIIEQIRESEATEDPQEEALRIQNLRLRKGCIIAREIVKHGNGKVFDELHLTQSQNLFHIAAQSNAHHILEELLAEALLVKDRGFLYGLLRKRSTLGWTPLGQALSQRHLPTIQLLAPYNDGDTLSHIRNAAGGGNVEILKAVLPESYPNFKALIESATRDQMPLAVAIDKSDTLSVEYLCKSQFDDGYLQSHIFSAATTGKLKVLEKLLAGKTDVTNLLTIDVFEVVAKKGYKDVWELLISRNGACVKDSQLLHIAVEASQIEIITSLIQIEPGLLKVRDAMKRPISQCGEQTEGIQMLLLDGMVRNFSPLEIKQLCTKPNGKYNSKFWF